MQKISNILVFSFVHLLSIGPTGVFAQSRLIAVRTAYSAVSAGIGTLWLTHEDGRFRKLSGFEFPA
ncbi:MAG TPA: hypothetical protein VEB61_03625 [Candidatus Binatia bacterium]|nr:hypothetical protein [Candidatus Binatia bacterium]